VETTVTCRCTDNAFSLLSVFFIFFFATSSNFRSRKNKLRTCRRDNPERRFFFSSNKTSRCLHKTLLLFPSSSIACGVRRDLKSQLQPNVRRGGGINVSTWLGRDRVSTKVEVSRRLHVPWTAYFPVGDCCCESCRPGALARGLYTLLPAANATFSMSSNKSRELLG